MRLRPLIGLAAGIVVAAALYWSFSSLYRTPEGASVADSTILLKAPGREAIRSPLIWYRSATKDAAFGPGLFEMVMDIAVPEGALGSHRSFSLVFPYVGGSAMEVRVNGEWVGSRGDMAEGRSSIWNAAKVFPLRPDLLRKENRIEVTIRGVYEAGIIVAPYIVDTKTGALRLSSLLFASDTAIWMLCGAILIIGLTIITLGLATLPEFDPRILLGVAGIATAFFMADFLAFEYLPLPLLEFKRAVVILRHLVAIVFMAGCLRLLGRKTDWFARVFMAIQGVCAILVLFPGTMVDMKRLYDRTYLTVLPLQFYLFYLMIRERKSKASHQFLLFGVSVAVLAVIRDILAAFLWPDAVLVSHFGFMILILSVAGYVVTDMADRNRQLVREKRRAERYREASMRDPLTGAFNRNIIPFVRESLTEPFSLVALDMDGLKSINDRYGHLAGDRVLQDFVAAMGQAFRKDDYIVRTGGDEFLAILPRCPAETARSLASELRGEMACALPGTGEDCVDREAVTSGGDSGGDNGGIIRYSASIGMAGSHKAGPIPEQGFQRLVERADADLYQAKMARG